jgi:hypothetical protein
MIMRLNSSTAKACAFMLLLIGSGVLPSVAEATEVDRNGTFINQRCGAQRSGCSWCTMNSCYNVTTCTDQKCTIVRSPGPLGTKRPPHASPAVLHGGHTNPTGPTLSSTHRH